MGAGYGACVVIWLTYDGSNLTVVNYLLFMSARD
jgi:hypothetical protein